MQTPITPVYRPGPIGRSVEIFVGQLTSDHWDRESAVIRMAMRTDLNIEWRLRDGPWTPLEDLALRLRRSALGTVSVPARATNSVGSGYIPGCEIGSGLDMTRVVAHWVNVPPLAPAASLKSAGSVWSGRVVFVAWPWTMTLDARSDLLSVAPTLRSSAGLAMTHVAELTKSDFGSFTGAEAAHVLFGFQTALSFAFGRWVAPALPVGFDHSGRRVWEQWAPWRCDPFAGFLSWFDTGQSGDLQDFVAAFMTHWLDPSRSDAVRHLAQHAISAGQRRTTLEARIMLIQAATEYLGWTNLVLSSRMTEQEYNSRAFPAAEKLRRLLEDASIPTELPKTSRSCGATRPRKRSSSTDRRLSRR